MPTKVSTSRPAFFSISTGHGVPPCCLKKSNSDLSGTTAGLIPHPGGHSEFPTARRAEHHTARSPPLQG